MAAEPAHVEIPAAAAQHGVLPTHCARHGRPAARRVDFALQSKVRTEGNRVRSANLLGTVSRLSRYAERVRILRVRGWPLCPACLRGRRSWLAVTLLLFIGGLAAFTGSLLTGLLVNEPPRVLAGVAAGGFVAMVLSAWPFSRAGLGRVASAFTDEHGEAIIVAAPSSAFVAALAPRGQAAGEPSLAARDHDPDAPLAR